MNLKLPLRADGMEIVDANGWLIARTWYAKGEVTYDGAVHRAKVIVAALTAAAEEERLGCPGCVDCGREWVWPTREGRCEQGSGKGSGT